MSLEILDDTKTPTQANGEELRKIAAALHASVLAVNDRVAKLKDAGHLPAGMLETWRLFREKWVKWYSSVGPLTWLMTSSTATTLDSFQAELANWDANVMGLEKKHAGPPWTTLGLAAIGMGLGFWMLARSGSDPDQPY
jgi:hypothetical protein